MLIDCFVEQVEESHLLLAIPNPDVIIIVIIILNWLTALALGRRHSSVEESAGPRLALLGFDLDSILAFSYFRVCTCALPELQVFIQLKLTYEVVVLYEKKNLRLFSRLTSLSFFQAIVLVIFLVIHQGVSVCHLSCA